MTRDWQPGDVASIYVESRHSREVAVFTGKNNYPWRLLTSVFGNGGLDKLGGANVRDARPLVVIDPEDREQVERLELALRDAAGWTPYLADQRADALVRALREFANPTPPKCGAVLRLNYSDGKGINYTCDAVEGHDASHQDSRNGAGWTS